MYWHIAEFDDGSLVIMTDDGAYYHVTRNARTDKAEKSSLGRVTNEADKAMRVQTVRELDAKVAEERMKEVAKAKRKAERKAEKERRERLINDNGNLTFGNKPRIFALCQLYKRGEISYYHCEPDVRKEIDEMVKAG